MGSRLPANALHATGLNRCRYNEIAELVVAAAQRRALQQRAARQGAMLVPGAAEGAVVKVGGWLAGWLIVSAPGTSAAAYGSAAPACVPRHLSCCTWMPMPIGPACRCTGPTQLLSSPRQASLATTLPFVLQGTTRTLLVRTQLTLCLVGSRSSLRTKVTAVSLPHNLALQEVYRAALFSVFFGQVLLAGALPRIGEHACQAVHPCRPVALHGPACCAARQPSCPS